MLKLHSDLPDHFTGRFAFDEILSIEGKVYRELNGRKTLRFQRGGKAYFLKVHRGVGWGEIVKNILSLRCPILSARNEWEAIERLEQLGIASTPIVGYGQRVWNPARRQSFLMTEELQNTVSLEDFCRHWAQDPPPFLLKRALIQKVADTARALHQNGVNHRDFYICHFHIDRSSAGPPYDPDALRLFVIDLHRAQLRHRVPRRWVVKDVAGLLFSSADIGLTRQDVFRFMKAYRDKPLRAILEEERGFWRRVTRRADTLYRKIHRRSSRLLGLIHG